MAKKTKQDEIDGLNIEINDLKDDIEELNGKLRLKTVQLTEAHSELAECFEQIAKLEDTSVEPENIVDEQKLELIRENFDKFTLDELRNFLKI